MKRELLIGLLLVFSQSARAVGPEVPGTLQLGNMTLKISSDAQRSIQKDVNSLTASPRHFEVKVDRARLYFPIIERIFKAHGIPQEVKYLVLQESALVPDAVSSANAVGFWQFKDFTAREVGLRVDRRIDERKNIVAASHGAARYLNRNNFYYTNWVYAIMAYNTGRGGAQKYIDESNFGAQRMTIDMKTHWYVRKFLAYYVAFDGAVKGPHSEGLQLGEYTDSQNKFLEDIALELKTDEQQMMAFNKWISDGKIPDDRIYTVIVPFTGKPPRNLEAAPLLAGSGKVIKTDGPKEIKTTTVSKKYPDELVPGLKSMKDQTLIKLNGLRAVLARKSDHAIDLSTQHGLTERKFRKNNDLSFTDELTPGEFYYLQKKKRRSNIEQHIVQKNESLWSVAQQYGIRKKSLAKLNRMTVIDDIQPGQILYLAEKRPKGPIPFANPDQKEEVPVVAKKLPTQQAAPILVNNEKVSIHTVNKGETLSSIARMYEVKLVDILRWNQIDDPNQITEGQNLQVKPPFVERQASKSTVPYTVEPGDTLYGISRKVNMTVEDLMELNGLESSALSVGQVLKILQ